MSAYLSRQTKTLTLNDPYSLNSSSCLLIFVKNPALGKVKTRLAKTMGDKKALEVYKKLLEKTKTETEQLPVNKIVYYSAWIDNNDLWSTNDFDKQLQEGTSLGDKMSNAIKASFEHYQKVVIIGSDCYDLSKEHMLEAFAKLENPSISVVIGPANDGGYYLLGMNTFIPALFEGKSWSQSSLMTETIETLESLNLNYFLLEELTDIDTEEDLTSCGFPL